MECCARRRIRAGFPPVENGSRKSFEGYAGGCVGTPSSSGGFRYVDGSSSGPLSARLLSGEVSGNCRPCGWIGCARERRSDRLVCGSSCCSLRLSLVDIERAPGSGPAGATVRSTCGKGTRGGLCDQCERRPDFFRTKRFRAKQVATSCGNRKSFCCGRLCYCGADA